MNIIRHLIKTKFSDSRYKQLRRFVNNPPLRFSSTAEAVNCSNQKENLFFDNDVQDLLKKLMDKDFERVFKRKREGKKLKAPEYKFMTDEQLQEEMEKIKKKSEEKLQMPPVVAQREEIDHVFIKDDRLSGYSDSKFVFTDISFGKSDQNRTIVVRDSEGTLRKATWEERSRVNEIYFPRPGRKIVVPEMFKDELLKPLLDQQEYEFVLDRACAQFEPDDPEYIRVCAQTYLAINETSSFNKLRSTRHYGPLVFYLASNDKIDLLLAENLETNRLTDAVNAILLFNILNAEKKVNAKYQEGEKLTFISAFIEQNYPDKTHLILTLKKYKGLVKQAKDIGN